MMRYLYVLLSVMLPGAALAQTSPNFSTGQIPTAAQWNSYFSSKVDTVGGVLTSPTITGGSLSGASVTGTGQTVSRTLGAWLGDVPNVLGTGAVLNGTGSDTTGYNNARALTPNNGEIFVPAGKQNISANPTSGPAAGNVLWHLDGTTYPDGSTPVVNIGSDVVETYLGGKYFGRSSAVDGAPTVRIDNTLSVTGGTSGFVVPALKINYTVNPSGPSNDFPWGIAVQMTSNGYGGDTVGVASYVTRTSNGPGDGTGIAEIWAANESVTDTEAGPSSLDGAMVADEMDVSANGADDGGAAIGTVPGAQGIRVGLDVVGQVQSGTGTAYLGWGVRVGGYSANYTPVWHRAFAVNGPFDKAGYTTEFGTEISGAAAFRMAAGQHLSFDASNTATLSEANGAIVSTVPVQLRVYTVSTLPACSASIKGAIAAVSDATAPTYNGTLTGGGAVVIPVFCNGSAWTAH